MSSLNSINSHFPKAKTQNHVSFPYLRGSYPVYGYGYLVLVISTLHLADQPRSQFILWEQNTTYAFMGVTAQGCFQRCNLQYPFLPLFPLYHQTTSSQSPASPTSSQFHQNIAPMSTRYKAVYHLPATANSWRTPQKSRREAASSLPRHEIQLLIPTASALHC